MFLSKHTLCIKRCTISYKINSFHYHIGDSAIDPRKLKKNVFRHKLASDKYVSKIDSIHLISNNFFLHKIF